MQLRKPTIVLLIALGIFALLLVMGFLYGGGLGYRGDQAVTEFHQTYTLAANGEVSISNVNGEIAISAWDSNQVQVDAEKHALNPRAMRDMKIEVSSSPDSIRIETKYPEHPWFRFGDNGWVKYTIKVPRGARIEKANNVNGGIRVTGVSGGVRATNVNGGVKLAGVSGPLEASTVNGSAEIIASSVRNDIRMHSVNGRVALTVPSDMQAEIKANTVNGGIHNDFGIGVNRPQFGPGSSMDARLGTGTVRIELKTVNGGIELRRASDSKPMENLPEDSGKDGKDAL
jgi:hypothetical protein